MSQTNDSPKPSIQSLRQRNAVIKRQIKEVIRERARAYLEEEHRRLQEELARLSDGFAPDRTRYT